MDIDMQDIEHLDQGWSHVLWGAVRNASSNTSAMHEAQDYVTNVSTHDGFAALPQPENTHDAGVAGAELGNMSPDSTMLSEASCFNGHRLIYRANSSRHLTWKVSPTEQTATDSEKLLHRCDTEMGDLLEDSLYRWLDDRTNKPLGFDMRDRTAQFPSVSLLSADDEGCLQQAKIVSCSNQAKRSTRPQPSSANQEECLHYNGATRLSSEGEQTIDTHFAPFFEAGMTWLECWQHTLAGVGGQFTDQEAALQQSVSASTTQNGLACSSPSERSYSSWEDIPAEPSSCAASVYSMDSNATSASVHSRSRRILPRTIASIGAGSSLKAHLHFAYVPAQSQATHKTTWVCRPLKLSPSGKGLCMVCGVVCGQQSCQHRMSECWDRTRKAEFYRKSGLKRHLTGYRNIPKAAVVPLLDQFEDREAFPTKS